MRGKIRFANVRVAGVRRTPRGSGPALVVPTCEKAGNEDMPRQRLADGPYELSANPGLHNVAESTRGKDIDAQNRSRCERSGRRYATGSLILSIDRQPLCRSAGE
jgi:hypothetical protein